MGLLPAAVLGTRCSLPVPLCVFSAWGKFLNCFPKDFFFSALPFPLLGAPVL